MCLWPGMAHSRGAQRRGLQIKSPQGSHCCRSARTWRARVWPPLRRVGRAPPSRQGPQPWGGRWGTVRGALEGRQPRLLARPPPPPWSEQAPQFRVPPGAGKPPSVGGSWVPRGAGPEVDHRSGSEPQHQLGHLAGDKLSVLSQGRAANSEAGRAGPEPTVSTWGPTHCLPRPAGSCLPSSSVPLNAVPSLTPRRPPSSQNNAILVKKGHWALAAAGRTRGPLFRGWNPLGHSGLGRWEGLGL